MANSTIQIPPDSTGKFLDTEQVAVAAVNVQRQRIQLAGAIADAIANVKNAAPDGSEYALCVRIVGGIAVSATLAEVLANGNDAAALEIINLLDPTTDQSADTRIARDTAIAAAIAALPPPPAPPLADVLAIDNDAGGSNIANLNALFFDSMQGVGGGVNLNDPLHINNSPLLGARDPLADDEVDTQGARNAAIAALCALMPTADPAVPFALWYDGTNIRQSGQF